MMHKKRRKKHTKERSLLSSRDVVVSRDFRSPYISKAIWKAYI